MGSVYESLIEYSGISDYIPKDALCYKEANIDTIISFKDKSIDVKEIVKVTVFPKIKSSRIIKTPKGKSLEGQELTGKKYIIEGKLIVRIDYIKEDEINKIYCFYYDQDFVSSMILHKDLINTTFMIPSVFVEGINAETIEKDEVLLVTTIVNTIEK